MPVDGSFSAWLGIFWVLGAITIYWALWEETGTCANRRKRASGVWHGTSLSPAPPTWVLGTESFSCGQSMLLSTQVPIRWRQAGTLPPPYMTPRASRGQWEGQVRHPGEALLTSTFCRVKMKTGPLPWAKDPAAIYCIPTSSISHNALRQARPHFTDRKSVTQVSFPIQCHRARIPI